MVDKYTEGLNSDPQLGLATNLSGALNNHGALPPRARARNKAAEISRFMNDLSMTANLDGGSLLSQLRPSEQREVEESMRRMDSVDECVVSGRPLPASVIDDYEEIIRDSERNRNETRAHRIIAAAGRMRLIEHLYNAGNATAVTFEMFIAMEKYPNLTREKNFVSMAALMDFANNADFMRQFREYGGDESRLELWSRSSSRQAV